MIAWTLTTAAPSSTHHPDQAATTVGQVLAAGSADRLDTAAAAACTAALSHFDAHADSDPQQDTVTITIDGTEILTGPGYDHTGRYDHHATRDGLTELHHDLTGHPSP